MKKIAIFMAVAVMLVSACNSDEEQTKAREGEREARVVKDVHLRPVQGSYGNRVITLRCEDSLYLEYRGQELTTLHHCSSKYEIVGGTTEEIAALSGCYEVDTLTGALLGTSLFARFMGDQVEDALLILPGNTIASDFSLQITPCHAQLRMVCFNTDQRRLTAKGIYSENPTDTAYAIGEWLGVLKVIDTVRVIDTLRLGGDTVVIRERDTVWEYGTDTSYTVDSMFTIITHNSEDPNGVMAGNVLTFTCYNSVTTMTYRNGQPYSSSPHNFAGKFPYNYSESGTYRTSHVGQAHRVVNGTASWGGFTQSFVHQNHYTVPAGYEAWLRYLNCDFVIDSVYGQATGILIAGHFECGDHHTRATYFMPKNPTGDNPPTVVSTDTLWGACGNATAWYQASPVEQVKANVAKTYRLVRTWSDSHRDTIAGGTATTTYTWNVIRTGQPTSAMASSLPVNGNPVSFGAGAFTEELAQVGSQAFCPAMWTSATLTSSTVTTGSMTWSGNYGGTPISVVIPEQFQVIPIIEGFEIIAGHVSHDYRTSTGAPFTHGFLYGTNLSTGQREVRSAWWHTGTVQFTEFDTIITIANSDTTAFRNQLNLGRYIAWVWDHRAGHIGERQIGFTDAVQNSSSNPNTTSWTVTYWTRLGVEANHVDLVIGTTVSNSGNSKRGYWNGTVMSADNGDFYGANL